MEESARASGSPPRTTILGGRLVSLVDLVEETMQPQGEIRQP